MAHGKAIRTGQGPQKHPIGEPKCRKTNPLRMSNYYTKGKRSWRKRLNDKVKSLKPTNPCPVKRAANQRVQVNKWAE